MAVATPQLSVKWTRRALLRERGVTHQDIVKWVRKERGRKISRQTVTAVLAGEFDNRDVEDAFCALTGASRAYAFPASE